MNLNLFHSVDSSALSVAAVEVEEEEEEEEEAEEDEAGADTWRQCLKCLKVVRQAWRVRLAGQVSRTLQLWRRGLG